jgi:uncharacterized membrane protein YjjP (DUF1212 family)
VKPARSRGTVAEQAATTEFLLRFVRAGHEAGYGTAELEERVVALARSLGVSGVEVSATPTLVEISLGPLSRQRTHTLRVRPARLDLGAIARLDDLVRDVLDGRLDAEAALAALAAESGAGRRPAVVQLAAYAAAGAALTPLVGGGWREAIAAALVGIPVGTIALVGQRSHRSEPVVAPLAAIAASFCSEALRRVNVDAAPDVVTMASLITLLPGMTLTTGVRDLAGEDLQSGVANTASALVQLLGLVFGVEIGRSVAHGWFGAGPAVAPHPGAFSAQVLASTVAGLAFTVTLRARSRDAWVVCSATAVAVFANRLGASLLGAQAGVFGAALALGCVGGAVGAWLRRSPLIFVVPGVLMLVPGSIGFESALQLLSGQPIDGITTAFDALTTAISIAYGLMLAALVLPRSASRIAVSRISARRARRRRAAVTAARQRAPEEARAATPPRKAP